MTPVSLFRLFGLFRFSLSLGIKRDVRVGG